MTANSYPCGDLDFAYLAVEDKKYEILVYPCYLVQYSDQILAEKGKFLGLKINGIRYDINQTIEYIDEYTHELVEKLRSKMSFDGDMRPVNGLYLRDFNSKMYQELLKYVRWRPKK